MASPDTNPSAPRSTRRVIVFDPTEIGKIKSDSSETREQQVNRLNAENGCQCRDCEKTWHISKMYAPSIDAFLAKGLLPTESNVRANSWCGRCRPRRNEVRTFPLSDGEPNGRKIKGQLTRAREFVASQWSTCSACLEYKPHSRLFGPSEQWLIQQYQVPTREDLLRHAVCWDCRPLHSQMRTFALENKTRSGRVVTGQLVHISQIDPADANERYLQYTSSVLGEELARKLMR